MLYNFAFISTFYTAYTRNYTDMQMKVNFCLYNKSNQVPFTPQTLTDLYEETIHYTVVYYITWFPVIIKYHNTEYCNV